MFSHWHSSWFAVQVVPRFEAKVATCLEGKGYLSFLPTREVPPKHSRRIKSARQPLFPGYLFCRSQENSDGLIVATPHVVRIVGFGGKPAPIDDHDIEALRRIQTLKLVSEPCAYLRIGDHVRVTEGPLSGLRGVLVLIKNRHRLVISIDAIMKSVSVEPHTVEVTALGIDSLAPAG